MNGFHQSAIRAKRAGGLRRPVVGDRDELKAANEFQLALRSASMRSRRSIRDAWCPSHRNIAASCDHRSHMHQRGAEPELSYQGVRKDSPSLQWRGDRATRDVLHPPYVLEQAVELVTCPAAQSTASARMFMRLRPLSDERPHFAPVRKLGGADDG